MTDFFNNTSNDYINPSLPTCPGQADTYVFEFNNDQGVIIFGSETVASIDLSDISQVVTGYTQQKKIVEAGEVAFIQGLTKGISYKQQVYANDGSTRYVTSDDIYYMSADLSISYYKNFRYTVSNVHAAGDYSAGTDIASALNIALGAKGINVVVSYDSSDFVFTGSTAGYDFAVSALDVSVLVPDTSVLTDSLTEDVSSRILASKYPNTAMLGYLLKVAYSDDVTDNSEKYVQINHVPNTLTYYEPSTGDANSYVKYTKSVDVGMNGTSTSDTMSAGDYLYYVDTNSKWEKVGALRIWFSAEDPATNSSTQNLITGFYVYNTHSSPVQIDYMILV